MQSSEVLYLHFGGGGVGAGGTESNIKALSTSLAVYARKATDERESKNEKFRHFFCARSAKRCTLVAVENFFLSYQRQKKLPLSFKNN